jgi:phosphoglucosamine mutase
VTLKFGTDGVRGVANVDLTPELVVALGRAAARQLGTKRFAVARDTRRSGPALQAALAAGLAAEGVDVSLLGVLPTPALAWLAKADGVAGAMISASHNPFEDNGIKLFTADGLKLPDDVESAVEDRLRAVLAGEEGAPRTGVDVGVIDTVADASRRWLDAVIAAGPRLEGLSLVVDAANGAASYVAPSIFERLGATVRAINVEPDGTNINRDCGATDPSGVSQAVVESGADAGFAFDGDADRVIAVDAQGGIVDGDHILAITAIDLHEQGRLADATVVVTVMSNLGFRIAMREHGIRVVETQVGDRYVLEQLLANEWSLGGEQSGHVIFSDRASTGDGILTALQVLDVMVRRGKPLRDLAGVMQTVPQVLRSVRVADRRPDVADAIAADVAAAEAALGERGRVLVRPSGTEPVVRVMVEAPTLSEAESVADRLGAAVEAACGGPADPGS